MRERPSREISRHSIKIWAEGNVRCCGWLQVLIDLHALSIRADVFVSRVCYTSKMVDIAIDATELDM